MTIDDQRLEERIVDTLRAEGLVLAGRRRRLWGPMAALGILLFAAAAAWLLFPRAAEPDGELYMLALYSGPSYRPDRAGSRAAEYGRWARDHREGPVAVVGGAELVSAGPVLGPAPMADQALTGYFLIRAPDATQALALARTTPHLRHGGTVWLRQIRGGRPTPG